MKIEKTKMKFFVPTIDILSQLLYYTPEVNYEKKEYFKPNKIPHRKK